MSELVKFSYTQLPVKSLTTSRRTTLISRPIIPLTILYQSRLVQYQALLDSGADYNVFHADIADYLGIKLTKGRAIKISGIGGDSIKGYLHHVNLKVGNILFSSSIVFSRQIPDQAIAVLGNQGLFNHFIVTFNLKDNHISLNKI